MSKERYTVDIKKLFQALDGKRRSSKLSWDRLETRVGVGKSTLSSFSNRKNIDSTTLACVIMYLKRPITDFIVKEKMYDNEAVNDGYRAA